MLEDAMHLHRQRPTAAQAYQGWLGADRVAGRCRAGNEAEGSAVWGACSEAGSGSKRRIGRNRRKGRKGRERSWRVLRLRPTHLGALRAQPLVLVVHRSAVPTDRQLLTPAGPRAQGLGPRATPTDPRNETRFADVADTAPGTPCQKGQRAVVPLPHPTPAAYQR